MKSCYSMKFTKTLILLALFAVIQNSNAQTTHEGQCMIGDSVCSVRDNGYYTQSNSKLNQHKTHEDEAATYDDEVVDEEPLSGQLLMRSIQGLEEMIDKVAHSKAKLIDSLDNMVGKVSQSRSKVMETLDSMIERMSESRNKMMKGFDAVIEKMSQSKENVMMKVRAGIDTVAHSKVMEEIDNVIESVAHSKVIEEIKAIPGELRESLILSVRDQSYCFAGLMVAVSSAILISGAIYYAWCHHDAWSYHIGTIEEAKALLAKAKESAEKVVSTASMASGGDFPAELCNMSSRGCPGETSEINIGIKKALKEETSESPKEGQDDPVNPTDSMPDLSRSRDVEDSPAGPLCQTSPCLKKTECVQNGALPHDKLSVKRSDGDSHVQVNGDCLSSRMKHGNNDQNMKSVDSKDAVEDNSVTSESSSHGEFKLPCNNLNDKQVAQS